MLRRCCFSTIGALVGLLCSAAVAVAADPAPNPPPGAVSVQPVSVSAGSPGQSGGTTTASTRNSNAYANGKQTGAGQCGVQAAGGGTGYAAQPNHVSTSGSSSSDGCATGSSTKGTGKQSSGVNANSRLTTSKNAGAGIPEGIPGANLTMGSVETGVTALGVIGLLGLAILLAFFFFLLGALLGRRRRAQTTA